MSPKPSRDVADALVATAPLAARWIQRLLASHQPPLTVAQFLALRAIIDRPVAAAELARRTGVSDAAVSQLVAELERDGLVVRAPTVDDRRRRDLAVSTNGRRLLRSAQQLLGEQIGALLADIPRPEADALARALGEVESLLAGTPPPRRPPPPHPKPPPPHRKRAQRLRDAG
jgi:DNA-binding MarR family transcriptional regulator